MPVRLKLKISVTTEPIWFSFTVKLLTGPEMVLGYLFKKISLGMGFFVYFFCSWTLSNVKPLDVRGAAASPNKSSTFFLSKAKIS